MIVIGADVHERSHTFVAVDDGGRKLESIGPTYNDRRSQTLMGVDRCPGGDAGRVSLPGR